MDVETHIAKHEQQKCDHVYTHTPYTRAFFQTINLQSAGCGQTRGVKPKAERRGGTLAQRSASIVSRSSGMAFRLSKKCRYGVPVRSGSV